MMFVVAMLLASSCITGIAYRNILGMLLRCQEICCASGKHGAFSCGSSCSFSECSCMLFFVKQPSNQNANNSMIRPTVFYPCVAYYSLTCSS